MARKTFARAKAFVGDTQRRPLRNASRGHGNPFQPRPEMSKNLINTGALARCVEALTTWELFQQFDRLRKKLLKQLTSRSALVHRAKATVLMRRACTGHAKASVLMRNRSRTCELIRPGI